MRLQVSTIFEGDVLGEGAAHAQSSQPAPVGRVVLLQGPVGPFFSRLQHSLNQARWDTIKINFNSGDLLYSSDRSYVNYTGDHESWPQWFEGFLTHQRPDAILMFGDQRPVHASVLDIIRRLGVKVVCFEEGYQRPEYITMELGGNNAASALRSWQHGGDAIAFIPAPAEMPHNGFRNMAGFAARYFAMLHLNFYQFPYYRHHRQRSLVREGVMWSRNAIRKWRWRNHNLSAVQNIVERLDGAYFVVALQVHDDLQLRSHGCGWSVERLVETSISSFARHAHDSHHLVIKAHPLDRGHASFREIVNQLAVLNQVSGRVHFVDDGSLGLLSRHSRGMVTINSTSAVTSLSHGRPVVALGKTFYEPMTANGSDRSEDALDRFWRLTPMVDPTRWAAFHAHMIASTQVSGSFYIPETFEHTCESVAWRLREMLHGHDLETEPVHIGLHDAAPAIGAMRRAI